MGDSLKYYDLSYLSNIDEGLEKRLGYKKIFVIGKDVHLVNSQKPVEGKTIVKSKDPKNIASALKDNNTIGVLFDDNVLLKKAIEAAGDNDKLVILSLSDVVGKGPLQASRNMGRIRTIISFAKRFNADISIVTLAARKADLTSTMQATAFSELL